jgi:hypothetical protein
MNKRARALCEFKTLKRDSKELERDYMKDLYKRIFDFSVRYYFSEGIDIYVDIKHFIEDGIERIEKDEDVWYKQDFIDAGLVKAK